MSIQNDNVYIDWEKVFSANIDLNITIEGKEWMNVDVWYCKSLQVTWIMNNVSTTSGDIDMIWDVKGGLKTTSGDVIVRGSVWWESNLWFDWSWDVEIEWWVNWSVSTVSGDISK